MYTLKVQAPRISVATAARKLGRIVFTLKTQDVGTGFTAMARRLSGIALVTVVALGGGACAGYPRPGTPAPEFRERTLTADEIGQVDVRTALDAVRVLRPQFLAWTRGSGYTVARLRVYVDHVPVSGPEILSTIPAVTVKSIRLLRAYEATFEYGTDNEAGALEVVTAAPRPSW